VAQGAQMAGAHYFVMYTSADGTNVTVSPRVAGGEDMPTFNSETQMELLEGSGVIDGMMTANIRCTFAAQSSWPERWGAHFLKALTATLGLAAPWT
jgi:hypothetical protein